MSVFLLALGLVLIELHATGDSTGPVSFAADLPDDQAYGQLPLYFEPNQGQTDPSVEFLARASGYTLYLTSNEAVLAPSVGSGASTTGYGRAAPLRIRFLGASSTPVVSGVEMLPGQSNYLLPCMAGPQTEIPHFAKVRYEHVYPGIDLVFYGNEELLEFDFVVAPAADPGLIRLGFGGAEGLAVDADGSLVVETDGGAFIQHAPTIYQEIDGVRRPVPGGYQLGDSGDLGFALGSYDAAHTLVIDPMLAYSTYLGSDASDTPHGIAVDSGGNAYITGKVSWTTFPTTGPNIGSTGGDLVLVTKLNSTGNGLVYSTFIGGCMGSEVGHGIAVDAEGNAYVTGNTSSQDFPTLFAPQKVLHGPDDAFLLKLNPAGSALVYSTYLGGFASDSGVDVAVDHTNKAYITGNTSSSDFPTWGAQQGTWGWDGDDTFVVKLSSGAGQNYYSTYLRGAAADFAGDIVVDVEGNAYVTGRTASSDFPTQSAFQGTKVGGIGSEDAYVTKLSASGALTYSTYLGGSGQDKGLGIDVDSGRSVYIAGSTESSDFPTESPFDGTVGGSCANFVTKLNNAGDGLVYSTYLGGTGACGFNTDIAVDATGSAHVAGWTASSTFPTVKPIQGAIASFEDGFVSRFSANGRALEFSTYLGGTSNDDCRNIAVDSNGNAYVLGFTWSSDFPTVSAFQPDRKVGGDLFVAKFSDPLDFFIAAAPRPEPDAEVAAAAEKLLAREQ